MRPLVVFVSLCIAFAVFTLSIYLRPLEGNDHTGPLVTRGKVVWQENNCQACHQFYGLGGYLGPDLTNVHGAQGKGPDYIRAIVHSGIRQMPAFALTEADMDALLHFLAAMDATGVSDPRQFEATSTGMIHPR